LQKLWDEGACISRVAPDWTLAQRDTAIIHGAHPSTQANSAFVQEEFADMVEAGQWLVLPYALVRHLPGLCLSPTGLVPKRDHRDRLIIDYTFLGVNPYTIPTAPNSLQFGHAFLRILQYLHHADTRRGPIYLAKVNIADAFMHVWLYAHHIPILAAILPAYPGETPLVVFPMILPMGWVESPQYMYAVTKTIADTANRRLRDSYQSLVPHRLDKLADSRPSPTVSIPDETRDHTSLPAPKVRSRGPFQVPLNVVEVYMDDFILLSQLSPSERVATRQVLFECIDTVIQPLSPDNNPKRKEPNSVKKLLQGDAHWSQWKEVLGWLIDTKAKTIELPPHRRTQQLEVLASIPRSQRCTSCHKWQVLVGKIRSMALALPGGRGLFLQLQSVLTYTGNPHISDWLCLTRAVHDQLDDFHWLASTLTLRQTCWGELVDYPPSFYCAVDASGMGMGGVWLHTESTLPPILWRHTFSKSISSRLVSEDNLLGNLTNSDFEQMGAVCQQDILAQAYDICKHTVCSFTDNTAALSRETRGLTSVDEPTSYLCRLSSLHQQAYQY
jgi:hypothetical protein